MSYMESLLALILRRPRRDPEVGRVPDITLGDTTNPGHVLVLLTFETDKPPLWCKTVAENFYTLTAEMIGNVVVVTRRPNLYPAAYIGMIFGVPVGFYDGAGAASPGRWLIDDLDKWSHRPTLMNTDISVDHPYSWAQLAFHEFLHCLGWPADHPYGDLWPPHPEVLAIARRNVPVAARIQARWRVA